MLPFVLLLSMAQSQTAVCDPTEGVEKLLLAADAPMDVRFSRAEHNRKIEGIWAGVPKGEFDRALGLYGKKTAEARGIVDGLLKENPKHGPALLLRARIAASASFRDEGRVKEDVAAFHAACPDSYAAVMEFGWLPDTKWVAGEAKVLRGQLQGKAGRKEALAYPVLWQWERTSRRSDEMGEVKAQWAKDLEWLRDEKFPRGKAWLDAVYAMQFYEELKLEWLGADIGRFFPHSGAAVQPRAEELRSRKDVAGLQELAKRYPSSTMVASYWISAVRNDNVLIADAYVAMKAAMALDPESYRTLPPNQINMAEDLVRRKVRMDLVPEFVFAGIEAIQRETAKEDVSDLYPNAEKGRRQRYDYWYLEAYFPLIEAYAAMGKVNEGVDIVQQAQVILNRSRPERGAGLEERNRHLRMEANFWRVKALLALARGKKLDALIAYRNALVSYPPRSSRGDDRDEVMAVAKKLALELGGQEAWTDWEAKQPLESFSAGVGKVNAWSVLERTQPQLKVKDMRGREFTVAELARKKTFVNLWATWCLPCRAELPYLEKVSEALGPRQDVVVVALNVDEDVSVVEPFLKRFGFRFGLNLAQDYAYRMLPVMAIPANYVVAGNETSSFYSEAMGDDWVKAVLSEVKLAQ